MTIDRDGGWARWKRDLVVVALAGLLGALTGTWVMVQHNSGSCGVPYADCREQLGEWRFRGKSCEQQMYNAGLKLRQPPR